jgi:hypothetical protein
VQVGAEGHHEHVALEGAGVGLHLAGRGVDRADRGLDELHAGLDHVRVRVVHGLGRGPAEHDVELGEPEHEAVGLVDEDDVGLLAELLGEPGRQLQPPEPCPEDHHPHGRTVATT